jgi:hypothetical protein
MKMMTIFIWHGQNSPHYPHRVLPRFKYPKTFPPTIVPLSDSDTDDEVVSMAVVFAAKIVYMNQYDHQ